MKNDEEEMLENICLKNLLEIFLYVYTTQAAANVSNYIEFMYDEFESLFEFNETFLLFRNFDDSFSRYVK